MSNIIFKGNAIKNFGEFYPNVYIDNVVVRNNGTSNVFLDISYTFLFHITDEFDKEDIIELLDSVNFYFAVSNKRNENKQLLTKNELIADLKTKFFFTSDLNVATQDNPETIFYPFSKENIIQNLNNDLFSDDIYDSNDRQVLIVKSEETINYQTENKTQSHIYLYAFTSLYNSDSYAELNRDVDNPTAIYDLSISDVSFEKIFSPNLNILTQIQEVYFDIERQKYPDVPILSLGGVYYKTETVTREEIISKVTNLVKRFTSKLSIGPLSETIDSINYVIDTFGARAEFLVQLNKVRKSFPNKTNNNRLGNLYAALSRLLINVNSSFLDGERLTKERIITGKVIDRREEPRVTDSVPSFSESSEFIPRDAFFIERNRLSDDEYNDLSSNGGFFFFRFESLLKDKSKLAQILDVEKLLEFPVPSRQIDLRTLLFSMLKLKRVGITKFELSTGELMSSNQIQFDSEDRKKDPFGYAVAPKGVEDSERFSVEQYLKENFSFAQGPTPEIMFVYEFLDLDAYPAVYELDQNEQFGGMRFKYLIEIELDDNTISMASLIDRLLIQAISLLSGYYDLATEICSYNNIQNRFNNFFVEKINDEYPDGTPTPWEMSVYMYSLVTYVLTDSFESVQDMQKYSRNLIKTISPEFGTLDGISNLLLEMQRFNDELFSSGTPYSNKKEELMSTTNEIILNSRFDVNVLTQNTARLATEAELEIQKIIDLFDFYDNIQYGGLPPDTAGGSYVTQVDESNPGASMTGMSFTVWTEGEYYDRYINSYVPKIFDGIVFGLNYIERSARSDTQFYDSGYTSAFTYNLNNVMSAGFVTGDLPNNFYSRTDFWPSGWQEGLRTAIIASFSRWLATLAQKIKTLRDTQLLKEGGLGTPFDYRTFTEPLHNSGVAVTELITTLENALKDAFLTVFRQALELDDEQGAFSDSEIREFMTLYVTDELFEEMEFFVDGLYLYYRDNMRYLLPDLNITRMKSNVRTAPVARQSVEAAEEYYQTIKDPDTQLPQFVTDENPYLRYTGPKLEDIPDLEYFDFDAV